MTERIYNFSAGPAVLPEPVLKQAQRDLFALPGVGMSVLEISHRSKVFESILARAEADLRQLAGVPAGYKVLFLRLGKRQQTLFGFVGFLFLFGMRSGEERHRGDK